MPTPRTGGIFKSPRSSSSSIKKPPAQHAGVQENDLAPEQSLSPENSSTAAHALNVVRPSPHSTSSSSTPKPSNASSRDSSTNGANGANDASESALVDFWVLLQQTQNNLQDMLVDLETAKVELDLANQRASEAQQQASGLRVQLSASEQKTMALEAQLHSTQAK